MDRRLRRVALLGVVLHTLLVGAAPFEHHDLVCHLKTPQHCTSCTANPVGSSAESNAAVGTAVLYDTGSAAVSDPISESALLTPSNSGRSPPVSA